MNQAHLWYTEAVTHDKVYIYGKHSLMEALRHKPACVKKVFLAAHVHEPELNSLIQKAKVQVAPFAGGKAPKEVGENAAHQGIIGLLSIPDLVQTYDSFIKNLRVTPDTSLVLLGEVQDPHNVGAVIRSAAAFGVSGVLIPQHNQAPVTGAVVKVSAGMAFRIPVVSIGNVNQTVRDLKEKGFWVYGLAGEGAAPLTQEKFDRPTVFILGNEADGIRLKTREVCDALISIPIHPQCESLNAAASTAVALYEWSRQHPRALK